MDARKKILHVCTLEKFIPPFIDFLEEHFDDFATRHIFFLTGDKQRFPYRHRPNIVQAQEGKKARLLHLAKLAKAMQQAEKIVIHGMFDNRVIQLLFVTPWVLKKCYWVIWGGDLYVYQFGYKNTKTWKLNEFFRRPVIKNIGYLVTGTPGDVELAQKWYAARGQHIRCFNYPSSVIEPTSNLEQEKHSGTNILVGNSADPTNNHKEIFDQLKQYKNEDIKIYAPLSYGSQEYAREVISYGKGIFGRNFFPVTEFKEKDKYQEFLQTIDIAIFNHKRQQAFGNTLMLLGYGKKVFIRKESTLNSVFVSLGLAIFDSSSLNIERINPESASRNTQIIMDKFSKQSLLNSLRGWYQ